MRSSTQISFICLLLFTLLGCTCKVFCQPAPNRKLCVQSISISGAHKTKPFVITRELSFRELDTLDLASLAEVVQRCRQNVFNLGIFNNVQIEPIILDSDVHFIIHVKERWYFFPVPKLIIDERNSYDLIQAISEGSLHRIGYGLDLSWANVTGRNETLDFSGQIGFTDRFKLSFKRPGILGSKYTDLVAQFDYYTRNEIITGTEGASALWNELDNNLLQKTFFTGLGIRKRLTLYKSLYMRMEFLHSTFADSIYLFNRRFLTNKSGVESYPTLVATYTHDTRDWMIYPLKGFRYQLMFRYSGPPGISSTHFAKVGLSWSQYLPLTKRWNLAYGFQDILTIGDKIPYFEKSAIGIGRGDFPSISSNLRGYEPYLIDGSFVHQNKVELKYALVPYRFVHIKQIPFKKFQDMPFAIYFSTFLDMGYVSDASFSNQDGYLKNKLLSGYGVGLNIICFYDRLFRVEYSTNHMGLGGIYFHGNLPIR